MGKRHCKRVVPRAAGPDKAGEPGQPAIEITCVIPSKVNVPIGAKPVIWRLLSNQAVETLEQATELVEWYRARWEITLLFLVLKEGYRVERLHLGQVDRLETPWRCT